MYARACLLARHIPLYNGTPHDGSKRGKHAHACTRTCLLVFEREHVKQYLQHAMLTLAVPTDGGCRRSSDDHVQGEKRHGDFERGQRNG